MLHHFAYLLISCLIKVFYTHIHLADEEKKLRITMEAIEINQPQESRFQCAFAMTYSAPAICIPLQNPTFVKFKYNDPISEA